MKRIRLYRHPECEYCANMSRLHKRMDWLRRVELSTETAPGGAMRMGEIEVERLNTGETFRGAAALYELAKQIPAYAVLLPLFALPSVRTYLDKRLSGCDGDACALPARKASA